MPRGRKASHNGRKPATLSAETYSLLREIADQSETDFVHVDDDKRYMLAALGREKYVERHGQDAKLTNKGRDALGLDLVEELSPDADRVIMDALAKAREAAPKPVVSKLPAGFLDSRQPRKPAAASTNGTVKHNGDVVEQPAPVATAIEPAAEVALDCPPSGDCPAMCLNRRALEVIFNRYPQMRQVVAGIQTIDRALEK